MNKVFESVRKLIFKESLNKYPTNLCITLEQELLSFLDIQCPQNCKTNGKSDTQEINIKKIYIFPEKLYKFKMKKIFSDISKQQ